MAARADARIGSAALTGSSAAGTEDRWSDIDLAFAVVGAEHRDQVIADWTKRMYVDWRAVHHVDVYFGNVLFRVFLLASTLQIDIAFWPADEFGPMAPTFRLLFGPAREMRVPASPSPDQTIGMGWLYGLHTRSSLARGRIWQAEYMLSGMRDQVFALACLRHGLPAAHGRGIDDLPTEVTAPLQESIVNPLTVEQLRRAFGIVTDAFIAEVRAVDRQLADRLDGPVRSLKADSR